MRAAYILVSGALAVIVLRWIARPSPAEMLIHDNAAWMSTISSMLQSSPRDDVVREMPADAVSDNLVTVDAWRGCDGAWIGGH